MRLSIACRSLEKEKRKGGPREGGPTGPTVIAMLCCRAVARSNCVSTEYLPSTHDSGTSKERLATWGAHDLRRPTIGASSRAGMRNGGRCPTSWHESSTPSTERRVCVVRTVSLALHHCQSAVRRQARRPGPRRVSRRRVVASHDQVMGRPFYLLVTASNCWTVASRTTELPCTMTGNDKFWFHQRKAHKKAGELAPAATSDLSRS